MRERIDLLGVVLLSVPFAFRVNVFGSVPLGIHENDTRSSITKKNGRSATAFALALTGRSAAPAKPAGAKVASDSTAAAIALIR
jgi:hypothetical protein